jgi:Stress responsive A/B Barrel Domain
MIERHVLIKLKTEQCNDKARREIAEATLKALRAIPQVRSVSVGVPADEHATAAWDLSLVVHLNSLADVQPYMDDAGHQRFTHEYLRPRVEVVKHWNFEPV